MAEKTSDLDRDMIKVLKRLGGGRYCFNCGHRIGLGGRFVGKHRFCNRCADMVEEEANGE